MAPWRARPPSLQHSLLLIFFVCNKYYVHGGLQQIKEAMPKYFLLFSNFFQIELRVYATFLTRVYMSSVIVMIVGILGGA